MRRQSASQAGLCGVLGACGLLVPSMTAFAGARAEGSGGPSDITIVSSRSDAGEAGATGLNAPGVMLEKPGPLTAFHRGARCDLEAAPTRGGGLEREDPLPLARKPKKKKVEDYIPEQNYRYDFDERHLTWGVDLGGAFANGITLNAFSLGGSVTPYFKGGFGDGNALEFDVTVGWSPLNAGNADWLYFRTPILSGSSAFGNLFFVAPSIAFKYELELTPSISQRGTFLTWGGVGLGTVLTFGSAALTDNGSIPDPAVTNQQIFFDIVPTIGFKARLSEFSYFELGTRAHLMIELASKLKDDTSFVTGTPQVIQEFWIGNSAYIDVFVGFSHDFG